MTKHVLMPTDGGPCSEQAIRDGLPYARALGAEVTFLYALEDPLAVVYTGPPAPYADARKAAQAALECAAGLAAAAGVPCHTRLIERTRPLEAIRAAERDFDLVVLGTRGRRGFERYLLGSVAEEALRGSQKPYLVFRYPEPSVPGVW